MRTTPLGYEQTICILTGLNLKTIPWRLNEMETNTRSPFLVQHSAEPVGTDYKCPVADRGCSLACEQFLGLTFKALHSALWQIQAVFNLDCEQICGLTFNALHSVQNSAQSSEHVHVLEHLAIKCLSGHMTL